MRREKAASFAKVFWLRHWHCWPTCGLAGCERPAVCVRGQYYQELLCWLCNYGLPGEWRWLEKEDVRIVW